MTVLIPKWVLASSLVTNLCFLGVGGKLVVERGGLARLFTSYSSAQSGLAYFEERRGLFESMPKSRGSVIFLGDSFIERCPWSELLEHPGILNRGVGGEGLATINARLDEVIRRQPSQIFVMAGANDLIQGNTPDQVLARYRELVSRVRRESPSTQIFVHSLPPVNRRSWPTLSARVAQQEQQKRNALVSTVNRSLSALSDAKQVAYVDIHSRVLDRDGQLDARYTDDGLHLNAQGYAVWAEVIRPLVRDGLWHQVLQVRHSFDQPDKWIG